MTGETAGAQRLHHFGEGGRHILEDEREPDDIGSYGKEGGDERIWFGSERRDRAIVAVV